MKLDTLSVQPTATTTPYTNVNQVIRDYYAGKPVLVRGYDRLSGMTIDCFEAPILRDMGYTRVEFRLGDQSKEVAL
jgi:hypothetical protein